MSLMETIYEKAANGIEKAMMNYNKELGEIEEKISEMYRKAIIDYSEIGKEHSGYLQPDRVMWQIVYNLSKKLLNDEGIEVGNYLNDLKNLEDKLDSIYGSLKRKELRVRIEERLLREKNEGPQGLYEEYLRKVGLISEHDKDNDESDRYDVFMGTPWLGRIFIFKK